MNNTCLSCFERSLGLKQTKTINLNVFGQIFDFVITFLELFKDHFHYSLFTLCFTCFNTYVYIKNICLRFYNIIFLFMGPAFNGDLLLMGPTFKDRGVLIFIHGLRLGTSDHKGPKPRIPEDAGSIFQGASF